MKSGFENSLKVGYVSCAKLPEPDIDEKPLIEALQNAGHEAVVVAWDDPNADWAALDVAVVRATWNYIDDVEAFSAWIDRANSLTTLLNPASTMQWNLHKGYLRELESGGVPIVPTAFYHKGQSADVVTLSGSRSWDRIVIKPSVGAGSFWTKAFDLGAGEGESAQRFFDEMIAQRDMMIQVFMKSVETVGETALIVIDGQLTHAIEKRPRFDDQDESVQLREVITDEMREVADRVLKAAGRDVLYARVDVMPDDDGRLVLSELEFLEPSLFFPHCPEAMGVFIEGLERRVGAGV